jgi:hypothetical protein
MGELCADELDTAEAGAAEGAIAGSTGDRGGTTGLGEPALVAAPESGRIGSGLSNRTSGMRTCRTWIQLYWMAKQVKQKMAVDNTSP